MPSAQRSTTPVGMDLDAMEGATPSSTSTQSASRPTSKIWTRDRTSAACPMIAAAGALGLRDERSDHLPLRRPRGDYVEGDAYVAQPGHLPIITAGTSVVEFTRTADLASVMDVIGRNIQAIGVPAAS